MSHPNQPALFDATPYETDGQKFRRFFARFIAVTDLNILYPDFTSDTVQVACTSRLYASHVLHGAWTDKEFARALFRVIKSGKKVSTQSIGEMKSRDKKTDLDSQ